jgi:general secretion pathway protein D
MRLLSYQSFAALLMAATLAAAQQPQATPVTSPAPITSKAQARTPTSANRRRAAKLFLSGAKLYVSGQFEQALKAYKQAAALDPTNKDYPLAAEVARSHAVTALIQASAKDRIRGDRAASHAALTHALELDPKNANIAAHLAQLADDTIAQPESPFSEQAKYALSGPVELEPKEDTQSFHLRTDARQLITQVFHAYGIEAMLDNSVNGGIIRFDIGDATFAETAHALSLATGSFYVPIDAHRVLVARDTPEMHRQYQRNAEESIALTGMDKDEMTEVQSLTRNLFEMPKLDLNQGDAMLTLKGPTSTLSAFNETYQGLAAGRPEVLLEVKIIQLAHSTTRNTGVQPPQTVTAFNVYAEEQAILNANQSLVQEIISSGLAAPGDTLAILGILLASGEVSSSIFSNGIALFGGGTTLSGLSPGPATLNLSLNSSDSHELDDYQLRLQDNEEGTLKSGTSYPIMTSSYSTLLSGTNISGLTSAGNSGSLSGILSSLSTAPSVPMIQYKDLGLTLKATPRILRSGEVALNLDMKILSLAGTSLNGIPALNDQAYSGVATVRANEAVVIASEMDASETRAVSGMPGLSEIPGMDNATDKDIQKSSATLLIIITPHVVRNVHGTGHSPMVPLARTVQEN